MLAIGDEIETIRKCNWVFINNLKQVYKLIIEIPSTMYGNLIMRQYMLVKKYKHLSSRFCCNLTDILLIKTYICTE